MIQGVFGHASVSGLVGYWSLATEGEDLLLEFAWYLRQLVRGIESMRLVFGHVMDFVQSKVYEAGVSKTVPK